ncbi:PiggyBac transposable element-derived protein 4 [Plakobranchus ocellatus]|uniref:PiggyBac transposable element-derived protein 4 n=1 Tax=Plakobranchus ocellatus TaxID=259542 RepID=A0AAV4CTY8_9GAST|nr:PiggyBac transposable element-derived protein 4 [Plakobranchus ocellatus]
MSTIAQKHTGGSIPRVQLCLETLQPSTLCAVKFEKDHGENYVKKLIEPYYRSGRNVTFDNFFTTLKLIQHLLRQGLTCVGTVRKDKKFIPEPLRHHSFSKDKQYTSRLAFQEKATMVSYKSKKNKVVTLLSTMHSDKAVSEDEKKKPGIVAFYNSTKGGVDGMDQKVHKYSCKRKSHRWPMAYFFNIVDVACLAAHVVFKTKFPDHPLSGKDSRSHFIRSLASDLAQAQLFRRQEIPTLHFVCSDCIDASNVTGN